MVEEARRRVEGLYEMYETEGFTERQRAFQEIVKGYLNEAEKEWEEEELFKVKSEVRSGYEEAANRYYGLMEMKRYYGEEIARYGNVYVMSSNDELSEAEMGRLSWEIEATRDEYRAASETYRAAAEAFAEAGTEYDRQYRAAKAEYEAMEGARYEYEKADAIQRWASTAYLGEGNAAEEGEGMEMRRYKEPEEELAYSEEKQKRAEAALEALKWMYAEGEEYREYGDAEYEALYREYEKSFGAMLLTAKARDRTGDALNAVMEQNRKDYEAYMKRFGEHFRSSEEYAGYYTGYREKGSAESWRDVIEVDENGNLRLSYGSGYRLNGVTEEEAVELAEYFRAESVTGVDRMTSSAFERQVREWSERMAGYNFSSGSRLEDWGLARDYLLRKLKENGGNGGFARNGYKTARLLDDRNGATALFTGFLDLGTASIGDVLKRFRREAVTSGIGGVTEPGLYQMQEAAWNRMMSKGGNERGDFEFYVVLSLLGKEVMGLEVMSQVSALKEYEYFHSKFNSEYREYKNKNKWYHLWFIKDRSKQVRRVHGYYYDSWQAMVSGVTGKVSKMRTEYTAMNGLYETYRGTSEKIVKIAGVKGEGERVSWEDIETALRTAESMRGWI